MRVAITGLAASWPQAEIAADIKTSLKALLFAQRQDEGQRREVANSIDLDQRLRLRIRGLGQSLDLPVVLLDLHRHIGDLMEQRAKCLSQTMWQYSVTEIENHAQADRRTQAAFLDAYDELVSAQGNWHSSRTEACVI